MQINVSFVVAPDHLLKIAVDILHTKVACADELRSTIRAVAKAYIDEADELKRTLRDFQTEGVSVQIESRSPPETIKKAKSLLNLQLEDVALQDKVHRVAENYIEIAARNRKAFDEFKKKYTRPGF